MAPPTGPCSPTSSQVGDVILSVDGAVTESAKETMKCAECHHRLPS